MRMKKNMSEETTSYAEEIGIQETSITGARDVMQLCLHTGVPGLMIGASSTAKTAAVRDLAAYNNARLVIFSLANKEPQDITGPQFPRHDGTYVYLRDGQVPVEFTPSERDVRTAQRACFGSYSDELDYNTIRESAETWAETFQTIYDLYILENNADTEEKIAEQLLDALFRAREGEAAAEEPVILFFDEVNRAERATLNAVMPIWAERKLGPHKLGKNVRVIAAMNPPGGAYAVTTSFSTDPAMRRRLVSTYVKFNPSIFARYRLDPEKSKQAISIPPVEWGHEIDAPRTEPFHLAVNEFLDAHTEHQYNEQGYLAGKVYGCPATWETASLFFETLERLKLNIDEVAVRTSLILALGGCVGDSVARDVITFYTENVDVIKPGQLFRNFGEKENPKLWRQLNAMNDRGDFNLLSQTIESMINIIKSTKFENEEKPDVVNSIGNLFLILDATQSMKIVQELSSTHTGDDTGHGFITQGLLYGMNDDGTHKGELGKPMAKDEDGNEISYVHPGWTAFTKGMQDIHDTQSELVTDA